MTFQSGSLTSKGPSHKKPIILCLHGAGTSATIYNIQSIRIQRPLSRFFEFLFVDGPFEVPAGPDVLPVFEGCDPFYAWTTQIRAPLQPEAKRKIDNAIKGREHEIVAVMGFSQGARLGAGLLLMQQLRQKKNGGDDGFKFGVFCMGASQPLISEGYSTEDAEELIEIPSVHFVGTEDPWYEEGQKLFHNHFDKKFSSLTQFEIGHRLPVNEAETMKIVEGIKTLYEETTGKALVDFEAK